MRLFLSLHVSDGILDELAALQEKFRKYGVMRCPVRENLHLTLKFLGEAEPGPVKDALRQVTFGQFSLELSNVGTFSERVLWASFVESKGLLHLKQAIDRALPGFPDDHLFKAHVTLARISILQDKKGFLDEIQRTKLTPHRMMVQSFYLMRSELLPDGPRHGEIATFPAQNRL